MYSIKTYYIFTATSICIYVRYLCQTRFMINFVVAAMVANIKQSMCLYKFKSSTCVSV